MLGIQARSVFSDLEEDFQWLSLSSWYKIPANSLPIRLITARVFDHQVYTRLTPTAGACFVVITQWGFPRVILSL